MFDDVTDFTNCIIPQRNHSYQEEPDEFQTKLIGKLNQIANMKTDIQSMIQQYENEKRNRRNVSNMYRLSNSLHLESMLTEEYKRKETIKEIFGVFLSTLFCVIVFMNFFQRY